MAKALNIDLESSISNLSTGEISIIHLNSSLDVPPVVWENQNPQLVLKHMRLLDATSIGSNKKTFYTSYKDWSKMSDEQINRQWLGSRN